MCKKSKIAVLEGLNILISRVLLSTGAEERIVREESLSNSELYYRLKRNSFKSMDHSSRNLHFMTRAEVLGKITY